MKEYIDHYRHGWNDANQNPAHGMREAVAVSCACRPDSPEGSCQLASRTKFPFSVTNYLTGRTRGRDRRPEEDATPNRKASDFSAMS